MAYSISCNGTYDDCNSYDGCNVKGDQKLTVTVDGKGPIGRIIADADATGNVRAYVDHPQTHFPLNAQGKLDVSRAVGTDGSIQVVKDVGMKDYFSGASPIVSGELGDDFYLLLCYK